MNISKSQMRYVPNAIIVLLTMVVVIAPQWASSTSLYLKSVLMVVWYIDSFFCAFKKGRFKGLNFTVALAFFFLLQLFYSFCGLSNVTASNYLEMWCFFDMIIKALYVKQYYNTNLKKVMVRIAQIMVMINTVWNCYIGTIYEGIHLDIFSNSMEYKGMYIATTAYYNFLAFFIGLNVVLLFKERKVGLRILDVSAIGLSYYFMLNYSPRTTALFISLVLVILLLILHIKTKAYRVLLGLLLVFIVFFMFTSFQTLIFDLLPERIELRVAALFSAGDNAGTSYLERFELVQTSLNTFTNSFKNFLFGGGYYLGSEYMNIIGQHSLITDYLAAYGCIGLFFLVYFFRKLKRSFNANLSDDSDRTVVRIFIFGLLVISLMSKSFVPEIACGAIFLPVLFVEYKEEL